ncbi:glucose 1-dehydrogenase [Roseomonas marmotae]|uniref:Glucose 1-dehydrogenase n=1 Tax=Roseomonas marmotae TaxID=2768161 RepID=A0ABS3KIP3_9PROT|nr:glucose 1-dehydrogenase [Roseomonas marmotae]MBO1076206.1 glucose 1-dehydrogenase [Roseomonas marmotae]QTI81761.1 glucose 1-dehydrogenase [Roseomonas marmotae]
MECRLDGQVAVVTGGSSGIGRGIAQLFAQAGAAVVVNYRGSRDGAEEAVREIEAAGGKAIAVKADVSQQAEVEAMFAAAVEHFGAVDILVANSGIQKDAAFTELTLEDWQQVIDTNLTGQFLCAQAAVRQFRRQGERGVSRARGKILCMSSVHEVIPWAGHTNYAASKGGISLLMKSLAQEVAEEGIRVNAIAPGAIRTAINADATEGDAARDLLRLIPYGRIGVVEDVARVALFLASDMGDYVVGATLFVDGGMTLYPGFRDNG